MKSSSTHQCPHCFKRFKRSEAPYRCTSIPQVCPPLVDEVYDAHHPQEMGLRGRLIHPSKNERLAQKLKKKNTASCPQCTAPSTQQVCPHCHTNLPDVFWSSNFVSIGVLCERPVVFETYFSLLKKRLESVAANDFGLALMPDLGGGAFDLYFDFTRGKKKSFQVRFYPLTPKEAGAKALDFSGTLILCDRPNCEPGKPFFLEALDSLLLSAQAGAKTSSFFPKRSAVKGSVATLYACFEDLAPLLPQSHPLFDTAPLNTAVREKELARISSDMLAHTGYWFGANALQVMKKSLSHHRLFCGSFAYPETQGTQKGWRVEDSFLWLLRSLKIL